MNSGDRWALRALALGMSAGPSAPSCAQKGEVAATSAKIAELSRAGKYAEAVPLAQGQLESLEKKYGPFNSDVAGALNNLALLYADHGRDAEAEPLYKRAIAIMEKVRGLDSRGGRDGIEQSGRAVPAPGALCRGRAAVQTRAGDPREVARPRSSRHRTIPQQYGDALPKAGPPSRFRAVVQARACDLRKGGRPGASGGRDTPQQSRSGRQSAGPI